MKYTYSLKNRKSKLTYKPEEKQSVIYALQLALAVAESIKKKSDRVWLRYALELHMFEVVMNIDSSKGQYYPCLGKLVASA